MAHGGVVIHGRPADRPQRWRWSRKPSTSPSSSTVRRSQYFRSRIQMTISSRCQRALARRRLRRRLRAISRLKFRNQHRTVSFETSIPRSANKIRPDRVRSGRERQRQYWSASNQERRFAFGTVIGMAYPNRRSVRSRPFRDDLLTHSVPARRAGQWNEWHLAAGSGFSRTAALPAGGALSSPGTARH